MATREHERRNREFWDADADDYQAKHGHQLARGKAWGVWAIPEDELGMLGSTRGLDVLEYGCGAAEWSIALAGEGARVVALDLSQSQLRHAARKVARAGAPVRLVCASGEAIPTAAGSFDLVFCDHGAMTFCDPYASVPEVARVLRRGGVLVFNHSTPLNLAADDGHGPTTRLHRDWHEIRKLTWPEGTTEFQLGHGEWIRLFRSHGLEVEDLVELQAPADATTTYEEFASPEWARRWPAEQIWKCRRAHDTEELTGRAR